MPENLLGMQISNCRYANMDFFKTPHIQIRFLGKDPVFKYVFLVLFSHPCLKGSRRKERCEFKRNSTKQFFNPPFKQMLQGKKNLPKMRKSFKTTIFRNGYFGFPKKTKFQNSSLVFSPCRNPLAPSSIKDHTLRNFCLATFPQI